MIVESDRRHGLAGQVANNVDYEQKVLKEETVTKQLRGFATMDVTKQREIARMGGKAAHAKGTAHEWSREQARLAGHKGGLARARRMEPIIAARKKQNQP